MPLSVHCAARVKLSCSNLFSLNLTYATTEWQNNPGFAAVLDKHGQEGLKKPYETGSTGPPLEQGVCSQSPCQRRRGMPLYLHCIQPDLLRSTMQAMQRVARSDLGPGNSVLDRICGMLGVGSVATQLHSSTVAWPPGCRGLHSSSAAESPQTDEPLEAQSEATEGEGEQLCLMCPKVANTHRQAP